LGLDFLATSLIVIIIPGTGVIYTVSVALGSGQRAGLVAAFACTLGIVPHLLAAVFGLSGFMHAGALAFRILKYVGITYLLYLAVLTLRSDPAGAFHQSRESAASPRTVVARGILLNLLNPKLTLFFFAFLPPFLSADAATRDLLGLGAVFMAMTFVVFAVYAIAAARLGEAFSASTRIRRRLSQSMGLLLAGFAVKLALTEE
jgi:threonine/homoserine/homoserine lactone efflux protein